MTASAAEERCEVCDRPVPAWPTGWLRTDDGRNYCPDHKGDPRFTARSHPPAKPNDEM